MAEKILIRKLEPGLWQWRDANAQGGWRTNSFYTGDINLLKESVEGKSVWLILNGQNIVTQQVVTAITDRRQLIKTLPYEVEENIIDPVEDMHFAYGPLHDGCIATAYGDVAWMQSCVDEVEDAGAEVDRCTVDYVLLPRPDDGWTLLLENNLLMAHVAAGVGFTVEIHSAGLYLAALAGGGQPGQIQLYADTEEGLDQLRDVLPPEWLQDGNIVFEEAEAGYWDLVNPESGGPYDFRSGRLARKLPLAKWWLDWQKPLIAVAAAFLIAVGVTWVGQLQADKKRRVITQQTDSIYRQVVPTGAISDPERQLRSLLGKSDSDLGSSNAIAILVGVGPAVGSFDSVKIRNFRYSSDNGQLQLNIEADSFSTFENLRNRIAEGGYNVEIRSANVQGNVHLAQLRISEAG